MEESDVFYFLESLPFFFSRSVPLTYAFFERLLSSSLSFLSTTEYSLRLFFRSSLQQSTGIYFPLNPNGIDPLKDRKMLFSGRYFRSFRAQCCSMLFCSLDPEGSRNPRNMQLKAINALSLKFQVFLISSFTLFFFLFDISIPTVLFSFSRIFFLPNYFYI